METIERILANIKTCKDELKEDRESINDKLYMLKHIEKLALEVKEELQDEIRWTKKAYEKVSKLEDENKRLKKALESPFLNWHL